MALNGVIEGFAWETTFSQSRLLHALIMSLVPEDEGSAIENDMIDIVSGREELVATTWHFRTESGVVNWF